MGLLIFYAIISIFFSFLCSILEAVLLSVTPTFLNISKQNGKKWATGLANLKKDVDKPLIAILTLNTIAHTVGAILVGNEAAKLVGDASGGGGAHGASILSPVGIISAVMTLLILVVSEIIPKTIGATYWKKLAGFTNGALNVLLIPLKYTGILWLLQQITKLFGSSHHGSVLSRADYQVMTAMAEKSGALENAESTIIQNLLEFDEVQVKDIMTPRTVMVTANEDMFARNFYKNNNNNLRFSRIPVYQTDIDNITGYVLKDDILVRLVEDQDEIPLKELRRDILHVKPDLAMPRLFDTLTKQREHIAIVLDDYGSLVGLVSMEDVIETLLGLEIVDEVDAVDDMQTLARKRWEERAKKSGLIE